MSDKSTIEWCDATWNVLVGCSKAVMPLPNGKKRLREGCRHCYAIRTARRQEHLGTKQYAGLTVLNNREPEWSGKVTLVDHLLDWPLRKKKPLRIFVNAHSDLFHEKVTFETILRVFTVMEKAKQHAFQVLTKRPQRMLEFCGHFGLLPAGPRGETGSGERFPSNVWLGVSVEDQASADYAIPLLLQTPAAVRWISAEPCLGPIDLSSLPRPRGGQFDAFMRHTLDGRASAHLDWVVCGGESGAGARPMEAAWARSLMQQCNAAGVPFFMKQGSRANWSDFKNFESFPEDLRVREHPEVKSCV